VKRLVLLGCALVFSVACARRQAPPPPRCETADAGTPVDPVLLSFLSRARAAHHLADDHESAADLVSATSALERLVLGPLPLPVNDAELAPEVREVLADTRARLADLRSRQGAFQAALADVRAGLEVAREPNYFRGHLLETEGLVEERRAKALESSDPGAAGAARKRAIDLLEQAMAVQSQVLEAASRGPTSAAPSSGLPTSAPGGR